VQEAMMIADTLNPSRIPKAATPMTFEEFLFMSPDNLKVELHNGEMYIMSPASYEHEELQAFLTKILHEFVGARGLGTVLGSRYTTRLSPARGYEPDVMFIGTASLNRVTRNYLDGPPDVAIEIISPNMRAYDLEEKLHAYDEGGVREYWVLDPIERRAHFFRRGGQSLEPVAIGDEFVSDAMGGFRLKLEWLWPGEAQFPLARDVMAYIESAEKAGSR